MTQPQAAAAAEERCDVVVVGAGLAALHLLARLPERLLKGAVVVDSSGSGWLGDWSQRCAALAAPHVRTPVMQHPHEQPLTLQAYAEKQGRQQELTLVAKGFAPVPSLALFREFCVAKVVGKLPAALRQPRRDTVLRIEQLEGADGPGCRVHLASGRVLRARAAIYTPANRQPVLPAWVQQLLEAQGQASPLGSATPGALAAESAGQGGDEGAAGLQTVPAQPEQQALPRGIATSGQVDLRSAELAGRAVVVVGGGMSAGLLAAGAAERGAIVTLVCRRPLMPQPFETEVGWWGAKQLNEFRQQESPALRLRACRRARKQGSVHLPVWRRLAQQAAAGRLTALEGWEVASAEHGHSMPGSDSCWRVTARRIEADPPSLTRKQGSEPTLFRQAVAAAAAAASTGSEEGQSGEDAAAEAQQVQAHLQADLVWLACGRAYDAGADPVLQKLQAQRPTLLAGGYALLDDESLCWPGAAVYLAGRGALLSQGPCAGDMPGMRLAADRIASSLQRIDFADAPVWEAAQQRLLGLLQRQLPPPASSASADSNDANTSRDGTASTVAAQLAAAVAAAAAALPELPLESEGRMYEEPRPKKQVARPDNIIDVSDLDPALPRRELSQYKFTDDDFEICVICQLDEAVPLEQVRVLFGSQHLEMWAVGEQAAYHLHLPRLYGKVITKKCGVKVNKKAKKVYLLLQKESDAEWRFLKG